MTVREMTFVVRADAGPGIGYGHLTRSLALADRFAEAGWTCILVCRPETACLVPAASAIRIVPAAPGGTGLGDLPDLVPGGCAVCLLDGYEYAVEDDRRLRSWTDCLTIFDDLVDRRRLPDVAIQTCPPRTPELRQDIYPAETLVLRGPAYAIVREAIADRRTHGLKPRKDLRSILVGFGGVDSANLTAVALEAVSRISSDISVDVMLPAAAPNHALVAAQIAGMEASIELWDANPDVADLMARADLAIGAAGTTSWERCALGLPALIVTAAGNQDATATYLSAAGAAIQLPASVDAIAPALSALIDDPARLARMSATAANLCDGRGAERVRAAILDRLTGADAHSGAQARR